MYRLLIPHIKPSVREIMIKSHWAPGLGLLAKVWCSNHREFSEKSTQLDLLVLMSVFANYRSQFLLDRLGRCL